MLGIGDPTSPPPIFFTEHHRIKWLSWKLEPYFHANFTWFLQCLELKKEGIKYHISEARITPTIWILTVFNAEHFQSISRPQFSARKITKILPNNVPPKQYSPLPIPGVGLRPTNIIPGGKYCLGLWIIVNIFNLFSGKKFFGMGVQDGKKCMTLLLLLLMMCWQSSRH